MFRRKQFRGGTHPPEEKKWTASKEIEDCPVPEKVIIPLILIVTMSWIVFGMPS